MKDFNKDKFDESIRHKFKNADIQPGNEVWEGIEAQLLKQDNKRMQRKAAFYRNVAAAVILIALVSIYFNFQDFRFGDFQERSFIPIEFNSSDRKAFSIENDVVISKPQTANNKKDNRIKSTQQTFRMPILREGSNAGNGKREVYGDQVSLQESSSFRNHSSVYLSKVHPLSPEALSQPMVNREIREVSYFALSDMDRPKERSSLAWNTNVNLGSGSFNPNSEITASPVNSTVSTLNNPGTAGRTTADEINYNSQEREVVQELSSAPMRSNVSFTVGLNAGVAINERWNIKSGLQYGNYRSSSNSSTVIRDRNSDMLFPYHGASSSTEISDGRVINVTSEYNFYNDFQILSIPLMASYKIIDRKLDIALVAGATGDFILKNTLRGGSDQINEVSFDQSDKQSYKNVFASGIAGIEFSYQIADKYALSVMPTYKRALTNVTTDNATFNSMPAFMGLNMSFAYIF